jgi:hypothetical protein
MHPHIMDKVDAIGDGLPRDITAMDGTVKDRLKMDGVKTGKMPGSGDNYNLEDICWQLSQSYGVCKLPSRIAVPEDAATDGEDVDMDEESDSDRDDHDSQDGNAEEVDYQDLFG